MAIIPSLYQSVLGASWAQLGERVQALHAAGGVAETGRFTITHGPHPLARLLAWAARLPRAGTDIPVNLRVETDNNGVEIWRRQFGETPLVTRQCAVDGGLAESFGLMWLWFRLSVEEGALVYRQGQAWLQWGPLKLPLPSGLAPRVGACEWSSENGTRVLVEVKLPGVGPLITYHGEIGARGDSNG